MLIYKEHYGVSSECKEPNMMRIHELQSICFEEERLYDTRERERELAAKIEWGRRWGKQNGWDVEFK